MSARPFDRVVDSRRFRGYSSSMLLRALILLAALVCAHAREPRSPVLAAISPASAAAPLPGLFKALDADGRTRALAALDRLDRAALDAAALAELGEAYRLLGRDEGVREAAQAPSIPAAFARSGEARSRAILARSGHDAAAQAAALSGPERLPGDMSFTALPRPAEGRGAGR